MIAPRRRRGPCRSDATATIAITSDAAVMSNPVWRTWPFARPPSPIATSPQRSVVDVEAAPPRDRERVDVELVAVQDACVEHRRQEIVRGADRVDVAGEVEVHVLHRDDLRVARAGGAALDPEHGPERGLAEAEDGALADVPQPLRQRDRRRRLALAGLRRRDRRDIDQLRVRPAREPLEDAEIDLRLVAPVRLDLLGEQARSLRRSPVIGRSCASWAISSREGIAIVRPLGPFGDRRKEYD